MFSLQVSARLHLLSELVKTEFGIGYCKEGLSNDMLPFEDTEKEKLYLRRELFYVEEEHIPRKTYCIRQITARLGTE